MSNGTDPMSGHLEEPDFFGSDGPYQHGFASALSAYDLDDNPFPDFLAQHADWEAGFRDAEALNEKSKQKWRMDHLRDHVIICGFGECGRRSAEICISEGLRFVVIDPDDENLDYAAGIGCSIIAERPSLAEYLCEAGVSRAKKLVIALSDDDQNLSATLIGRAANETVFIEVYPRCDIRTKLMSAGANQVILG